MFLVRATRQGGAPFNRSAGVSWALLIGLKHQSACTGTNLSTRNIFKARGGQTQNAMNTMQRPNATLYSFGRRPWSTSSGQSTEGAGKSRSRPEDPHLYCFHSLGFITFFKAPSTPISAIGKGKTPDFIVRQRSLSGYLFAVFDLRLVTESNVTVVICLRCVEYKSASLL